MPSITLGEILLEIEPIMGLYEWDLVTVLKFVGSFIKNLSDDIGNKP